MVSKQSRALQAFRRVEAWFADHPAVIPASGSSAHALGNQVNALAAVVARMTAQGTEQITQRGQATLAAKDEPTLRSDLRTLHMRAIVKVASALRGQVPGVGVIKMPADSERGEGLVKAAEALYTTASVYREVFVAQGLPQDFLDQLAAATSALKSSIDARGMALSKRSGATTGLAGDYDLGRRIVSMIDASLAHALKSDPVTLASWRQVKRVTVKRVVTRSTPAGAPLSLVAAPSASDAIPDAHGMGSLPVAPETAAA